jgi:hypothetical protein
LINVYRVKATVHTDVEDLRPGLLAGPPGTREESYGDRRPRAHVGTAGDL